MEYLPPEILNYIVRFLTRASHIAWRSTSVFFHDTLPRVEHTKEVYEDLGKEPLAIIQWLIPNASKLIPQKLEAICEVATKNGYLPVVRWS